MGLSQRERKRHWEREIDRSVGIKGLRSQKWQL